MSVREVIVGTLLVVGVLGFAMNAIGLLLCQDVFDQIHYLAPGSLVGAVAIPAAVLVQEGAESGGCESDCDCGPAVVIESRVVPRDGAGRPHPAQTRVGSQRERKHSSSRGAQVSELALEYGILIFVAAGGTAVVFTRDTASQAVVVSFYGLLLSILFFVYRAPDVGLSQIVVGAVALPLMIVLALASVKKQGPKA